MRAFWGIFASNRRKFNSEIQDPKFGGDVANDATMSRWGYDADKSDDVTWARRLALDYTWRHWDLTSSITMQPSHARLATEKNW
jgi:hypothetical protein